MICVCFGTNSKLKSKLVRWVTGEKWTHTWIEYPSTVWGGLWVAHSSSNGVVKVPQERVQRDYPLNIVYECKADLSHGFMWARGTVSMPYDWGVIWNAVLLLLFRATGWKWLSKFAWRCPRCMTCSEWVTSLLKAASVKGLEGYDPELTTSGTLEKFCSESDDFEIIQQ